MERKIRNFILNMLTLKYLQNIKVEMISKIKANGGG